MDLTGHTWEVQEHTNNETPSWDEISFNTFALTKDIQEVCALNRKKQTRL